jgi:hypothetical protein
MTMHGQKILLSAMVVGCEILVHMPDAQASCDGNWSVEDANITNKYNATPSLGAVRAFFGHACLHNEKIDYQFYANGSIWASEETGPHYIQGSIESDFVSNQLWDWDTTAGLGFPVSDPMTTADGLGTVSHFALGKIYVGGFTIGSVKGGNESKWNALGGVRSALGYPISDTTQISGTLRNTFQYGWLTSSTGFAHWQSDSWPVLTGTYSTPAGSGCSTPGMDAWNVGASDAFGGSGHVRALCLQAHTGQRIQFFLNNTLFRSATIPSTGIVEFDTGYVDDLLGSGFCDDFNCYATFEARVGNSTPTVFMAAAFGTHF